jgi:dienelactone hydrolase
VTLPNDPPQAEAANNKHPVVFFLNGFMLRAGYYKAYASRLASWGFAVVQYDVPLLSHTNDRIEVGFVPQIMSWIERQPDLEQMDLTRVGLSGHSRGAKLAALLLASGQPAFKAAFLVEPVDNTRETPESKDYPSAAKALQHVETPVATVGASRIGSCNPAGSNWQHFYNVVKPGSWLMVVKGASHATFTDAGLILNKAFDLLCKCGQVSRQEAIGTTLPLLVAWMDTHVKGSDIASQSEAVHQTLIANTTAHDEHDTANSLDRLFKWIQREVEQGKITFIVKSSIAEGDSKGDPVDGTIWADNNKPAVSLS